MPLQLMYFRERQGGLWTDPPAEKRDRAAYAYIECGATTGRYRIELYRLDAAQAAQARKKGFSRQEGPHKGEYLLAWADDRRTAEAVATWLERIGVAATLPDRGETAGGNYALNQYFTARGAKR